MKAVNDADRVFKTGYLICWSVFMMIFMDSLRILTVFGELVLFDVPLLYPAAAMAFVIAADTVFAAVKKLPSHQDGISARDALQALAEALGRYDLKSLSGSLIFGAVLFIADRSLFWISMVPFFAAGSRFSVRTRLKPVLYALLLKLAVQTGAFALGLSEDVVFTFSYGTCRSLGFANPNTTGALVLLSFLLAWYIFSRRQPFWYAASLLLAGAVFFINGCRSAAVLLAVLPFLHMTVCGYRIGGSRMFKTLFTGLPFICAAMTFVLGLLLLPLDGRTGGNFLCRFVEGIYAWRDFGISLFGRPLPVTERTYYFDNAYVSALYEHGLIYLAAFLSAWTLSGRRITEMNDRKMASVCICLYAFLTMEKFVYLTALIVMQYLFGSGTADDPPGSGICGTSAACGREVP